MAHRIDVPGMGIVEFPDEMSDEQIVAAIKKNTPQKQSGIFDVVGDIGRDVSAGWQNIKEGFGKRLEPEILPTGPLQMGRGALEIAGALPNALVTHPFGRAVEKGTGGMITQDQAETALMALPGPKNAPRTIPPEAPTREMLKMTAKTGYQTLDAQAANLPQPVIHRAVDQMLDNMHNAPKSFREDNPAHAPAFRELRRLQSNPTLPSGAPQRTTTDFVSTRQALAKLSRDRDPATAAAARAAMDEIDRWMSNIPHLSDLHKATTSDYAAAKRSEKLLGDPTEKEMAGAVFRGETQAAKSGTGANLENTLRQRIDEILSDRTGKKQRGWSREELELMNAIVRGGPIRNFERYMSRFGPRFPLYALLQALGWSAGHPYITAGLLGSGEVARFLGIRKTRQLIEQLDEATRRRSALGGSMPGSTTTAPTMGQGAAAIVPASSSVRRRGTQEDPIQFSGSPDEMTRQFVQLPGGVYFRNPSDGKLLQKPY